jgi:hypothetical protein
MPRTKPVLDVRRGTRTWCSSPIPPSSLHRPDAHLVRAPHARGVHRRRRGAARVQQRNRRRAPARALPTQSRPIGANQPAQRRSSRRLRQQYPVHIGKWLWGKHFWSPSYFAASCGGAPLTIIKQHIDQQNRPDQSGPLRRAAWKGTASPDHKQPDFHRRNFE